MSVLSNLLLTDARALLVRTLALRPQGDLAIVFGYWMQESASDEQEAKRVAGAALQHSGAQLDFQTVAILGYAIDSGLLGSEASTTLKDGLERLAGRSAFVDEIPMPFCSDAVGLLGVALGTRSLSNSALSAQVNTWFSGFLPKIDNLHGTESWQRCFFRAVAHVLKDALGLPAIALDKTDDVRIALAHKGVLAGSDGLQAEKEEEGALKVILHEAAQEISYERAAIRLAALDRLLRTAPAVVPGRIAPRDLVRLLERIPAGLRKWTWETKPRTATIPACRWHIDHEYHVQNLLWTLLAPVFPDLDDEQYLAKIGQKSPRADLHIPSMKLIVEAKFVRPSEQFQKVIDEISSDTGLYAAMGNGCEGIIPVVWDDSARSHEHDYLRQGLRKLPKIVDAIVIARPSNWDREAQPSAPKRPRTKKTPTAGN